MLRAEGIHKIYKDGKRELKVLKGIDLNLSKGELVSVVGPSGAGKSTLLHILGGIDRPSQGRVFLDELDFYTLNDRKRSSLRNQKIGFVFQFYHLLPEFTALENVMLPGIIRCQVSGIKYQVIRERARNILEEIGLGERLSHRPSELSGGEQQRVAIARALVNEPALLLCDEPTGNLDSKMGEEILEILLRLNRIDKRTIVIVTHDKEIAKKAGRIIEMRDGRLI